MEEISTRKIIVGVGGVVVALAVVVALYFLLAKPRLKAWNDVRVEVKNLEKTRNELRGAFGGQDDPNIELKVLQQEIESLETANEVFGKIKKPGVEASDLPRELKDPDQQIRLELFRDYLKEVMSIAEKNIKEDLKDAGIVPPRIELYTELNDSEEAAYYMNRAGGLKGLVNAIIKTRSETNKTIGFDDLKIEDYEKGIKRRAVAGNTLSYSVEMIMDMQSLMAFAYNLEAEDGYYFFEEMTIKSAARRVSADARAAFLIDARINTVRIYKSEVESAVQSAINKAADASKLKTGSGKLTGFWAGIEAGKKVVEEARAAKARKAQQKWYEFWK